MNGPVNDVERTEKMERLVALAQRMGFTDWCMWASTADNRWVMTVSPNLDVGRLTALRDFLTKHIEDVSRETSPTQGVSNGNES